MIEGGLEILHEAASGESINWSKVAEDTGKGLVKGLLFSGGIELAGGLFDLAAEALGFEGAELGEQLAFGTDLAHEVSELVDHIRSVGDYEHLADARARRCAGVTGIAS